MFNRFVVIHEINEDIVFPNGFLTMPKIVPYGAHAHSSNNTLQFFNGLRIKPLPKSHLSISLYHLKPLPHVRPILKRIIFACLLDLC